MPLQMNRACALVHYTGFGIGDCFLSCCQTQAPKKCFIANISCLHVCVGCMSKLLLLFFLFVCFFQVRVGSLCTRIKKGIKGLWSRCQI